MKNKLNVPAAVTAQIRNWQSPRRGKSNPENQTNEVWSWIVQNGLAAYQVHGAAGQEDSPAPAWCFDRYGRSETILPDGTKIYIGGEHEDFYDPDFYIYNDVVVKRLDGTIEVYGYPEEVFPPTDFHSATLCGEEIIIIGGLRYPEIRDYHTTWVFRLQLSDFSIHPVATAGQVPAWLTHYQAKLADSESQLIVSGGQVMHHPTERPVENLTTWVLDLYSFSWSARETKPFQRWILLREDECLNELRRIGTLAKASQGSLRSKYAKDYEAQFAQRGHRVDADLYFSRFSPPVPHQLLKADTDEYPTRRLLISGIMVRIYEDMHEIVVTVEGVLEPDVIEKLQRFGVETYSALEGVPYKLIEQ